MIIVYGHYSLEVYVELVGTFRWLGEMNFVRAFITQVQGSTSSLVVGR